LERVSGTDSGRYQALHERGFCVSYGDGKIFEFSCKAPLTLVKDRQTEKMWAAAVLAGLQRRWGNEATRHFLAPRPASSRF